MGTVDGNGYLQYNSHTDAMSTSDGFIIAAFFVFSYFNVLFVSKEVISVFINVRVL